MGGAAPGRWSIDNSVLVGEALTRIGGHQRNDLKGTLPTAMEERGENVGIRKLERREAGG